LIGRSKDDTHKLTVAYCTYIATKGALSTMEHKANLSPRILGRSSLRHVLLGGIAILPSAFGAILPLTAVQAQTVTGAYPGPLAVTAPDSNVTVTSTGIISGGSVGVLNLVH
jgi:hypothetical protein